MTGHTAKVTLKKRGWTQQKAAKEIGVTFEHLNRCLNGHRESRRLMRAIESLPVKEAGK